MYVQWSYKDNGQSSRQDSRTRYIAVLRNTISVRTRYRYRYSTVVSYRYNLDTIVIKLVSNEIGGDRKVGRLLRRVG
jgi:hypothetical protein